MQSYESLTQIKFGVRKKNQISVHIDFMYHILKQIKWKRGLIAAFRSFASNWSLVEISNVHCSHYLIIFRKIEKKNFILFIHKTRFINVSLKKVTNCKMFFI